MQIKIGTFEYTECWDGVLYKALSDPPHITDWEMQTVADFIAYERANGRTCTIEADEPVRAALEAFLAQPDRPRVPTPEKITECTACPRYRGCLTDLVCHTSPAESAVKILRCGALRSPVRARGISAEALRAEARNAANDPADYFDYILFSWGNCQAGDRLVMERKLGRFPDERDLSVDFTPGVRFFFRYDKLLSHPGMVRDGVLPLRIRDELTLRDWVHAIIVPEQEQSAVQPFVPAELAERVFYLPHEGEDIWRWAEKVYEFARTL